MESISTVQEAILLTQNIYPQSPMYNVGGYALIKGELDIPMLIRSIEEVLRQADAIDIARSALSGSPSRAEGLPMERYSLEVVDLSTSEDPDAACLQWMRQDIQNAFDSRQHLLSISLLTCRTGVYYWYTRAHHLLFDGYSMSLFFNTVAALYTGRIAVGAMPEQPDLWPYQDFIDEELQYKGSVPFHTSRAFWSSRLSMLPSPAAFESCLRYPDTGSLASTRKEVRIDRELFEKISQYCLPYNCTAFHYFIAALLLLNRYYNNDTAVLGLSVFNRRTKKSKATLGTFVNVLPFSIPFAKDIAFADLLISVRDELRQCYKHQEFSVYQVLDELDRKPPLYNVLFSYQKNSYHTRLGEATASIRYLHNGQQQEDLAFHLLEYAPEEDLVLALDHRVHRLPGDMAGRMLDHFIRLLTFLLSNPGPVPLTPECMMGESERQALGSFNLTEKEYFPEQTMMQLWEAQVNNTPDRTAIVFAGRHFTFRELNECANRLGRYIKERCGVVANDRVAVKLARGEKMIIALIGVLKAGGAYVPVDPDFPAERQDYIIRDSESKLVIDEEEWERFDKEMHRYGAHDMPICCLPGDLIYILYTSGSTGQPKGCMLEHRGVINRIEWMWQQFGFSADDIILQKTNFTFDVSVWEIFLPLCWGARMVLCEKEDVASPQRIAHLIREEKITCLHFVPSMLNSFIGELFGEDDIARMLVSVRRVITSGEALLPVTVKNWYDKIDIPIYNLYGPTEASIDVTYYVTCPGDQLIPIGRPIWNTHIYITGKSGQQLPIGVAGEISLGGAGIARGYINKAELTAEKFVPDPFCEGARIYRTGDIGRWLPDGDIEFLGRKDFQVKIRGYRIELAEIETALLRHPHVREAAVAVFQGANDEKEVVAYLVGDSSLELPDVRKALHSVLPAYMLPGHFVFLDRLPLTSSGKLDRKKLPAPELTDRPAHSEYIAPRTEIETRLAAIWQDILQKDKIGVKDNFFDLGGHSLKITRLASRIYKDFHVRIELKELFSTSVLEDQAVRIATSRKISFSGIPSAGHAPDYPLSSAQRRLWATSQFPEAARAYHMPGVYELDGALNNEALGKAFDALLERHEILRTVFREDEKGEIRQLILAPGDIRFRLAIGDLRGEQPDRIRDVLQAAVDRPFDLKTGPLLRAGLYRTGETKWAFAFVIHHIISDGWSIDILGRELSSLYNAAARGSAPALPPMTLQYKDYAVWQQQRLKGTDLADDKSYWTQQLKAPLPVLELPADHVRPSSRAFKGGLVRSRLGEDVVRRLQGICRGQQVTLFMGVLAAIKTLLSRYSGQKDLIIGSPAAGRMHQDLDNQIGFYINLLPLRTRLEEDESFISLLKKTRQVTLEAYAHQEYPFDELVDVLDLRRDLSRNILFDVLVVWQDGAASGLQGLHGVRSGVWEADLPPVSKFDLTFTCTETGSHLLLDIEYDTGIYSEHTVQRMALHLQQLTASLCRHPQLPLSKVNYLQEEEVHQLLHGFNDTDHPYDAEHTVTAKFGMQAALRPGEIALDFNGNCFTYAELNEMSGRLGAWLKRKYDIGPGCLVGVKLQRGPELIIALLAILKAGGAYVPVDPDYPADRVAYIIEDSHCKLLIDGSNYRVLFETANASPENEIPESAGPRDLMYVIYTSGSTGRPKGCMVEHRGVVNRLEWMWHHYGFTTDDVILQKTTFTFDVSVWELFMPLCWGAKMILCSKDDIASPERILDLIHEKKVTCLHFVPSMLSVFMSVLSRMEGIHEKMASLTKVITSGEALTPHQVKEWYSLVDIPLHNLYGPTEASVDVTYYPVTPGDTRIPIGRPIWNTYMYILAPEDQLTPVGIPGEICIGGDGLARGYLKQPQLTAEKFVPDPFREGRRIYRTGDIGRWLPDGNIEYMGRKDHQVKIRGYRIELGEIENVLNSHADIDLAAVTAWSGSGGEKELVAYLTGTGRPAFQELKAWLAGILPAYMIPAHFIWLDTMPLTSSGKTDRKLLPAPDSDSRWKATAYTAPRNDIEHRLAGIWEEILGVGRIGVHDNFLDLGGHSLKAVRLATRINTIFNIRLSIQTIFTTPTIESQSEQIAFLQHQNERKENKVHLIQIEL